MGFHFFDAGTYDKGSIFGAKGQHINGVWRSVELFDEHNRTLMQLCIIKNHPFREHWKSFVLKTKRLWYKIQGQDPPIIIYKD
jgi:hypothetical protein